MRDVAEWIRGTLASRREAKRPPPGKAVLGAVLHDVVAERAKHGLLVVTHGTERLIDDDGAPIHVFEDGRAAAILFVGSTTEPGPGAALLASEPGFQGPRINGDAVRTPWRTYSICSGRRMKRLRAPNRSSASVSHWCATLWSCTGET